MIAALVLIVIAGQERTVTFTHPCAHSSVVLEAFGNEIGETIKISGSVDKDYFLVRFEDMPVGDAKAAIAKTLDAKWVIQDDVLYLTRTVEMEKQTRDGQDRILNASVEQEWKAAKERSQNQTKYDLGTVTGRMGRTERRDWYTDLADLSPSRRFRDRIMLTMTPQQISALPQGTTYYSTNPDLDTRPMPAKWFRYLHTYRVEDEIWDLAESIILNRDDPFERFQPEERVFRSATLQIEKDETSIRIRASDGQIFGVSVSGYFTDAGYRVNTEWDSFLDGIDGYVDLSQELIDAWQRPEKKAGEDEYLQYILKLVDPGDRAAIFDRIVEDIEQNEPLGLIYSWPLLEGAKQKGANMVALLPDSMMFKSYTRVAKRQALKPVLEAMRREFVSSYDKDLDCWMIDPYRPQVARDQRADRAALGRLLRSVDAKGWLTLDDAVQFQRESGLIGFPWAVRGFTQHAMNSSGSAMHQSIMSGQAMLLYSMLGPAQRKAAWSGGIEVPRRAWPPWVERSLRGFEMRSRFYVPVDNLGDSNNQDQPNGQRISAVMKGGLPAGSSLKFRVEAKTDIVVTNDRNWGIPVSPEVFAKGVLEIERMAKNNTQSPYAMNIDRACAAPSQTLHVTLVVPGIGYEDFYARFTKPTALSDLRPYEELPAVLRKQVADALAKAREGGR